MVHCPIRVGVRVERRVMPEQVTSVSLRLSRALASGRRLFAARRTISPQRYYSTLRTDTALRLIPGLSVSSCTHLLLAVHLFKRRTSKKFISEFPGKFTSTF